MVHNTFSNSQQVATFLHRGIDSYQVLVVGDIMLDRYYFGDVRRISPEAPVPIVQIQQVKETLGGAANVCHNLARLGCQVYLAGVTGNDHMRSTMIGLLAKHGINEQGLVVADDRPTISKTRVIGGHQQILRLDFEEAAFLQRSKEKELLYYIMQMLPTVDSVIISDYGKGVCSPKLCQTVIKECKTRNIPLVLDPKGVDWGKYKGAFLITPNLKELGEAAHGLIKNDNQAVEKAAQKLRSRYQLDHLVVTRSEKGLSLINENDLIHVPTMAQEVFDVSGAGDTVVAVLGAALADGICLGDASILANIAAGVVVGKLGTYAISKEELAQAVTVKEELKV